MVRASLKLSILSFLFAHDTPGDTGSGVKCFASTGVNTPETMFPDSGPVNIRFPEADSRERDSPCFNFRIADHARAAVASMDIRAFARD